MKERSDTHDLMLTILALIVTVSILVGEPMTTEDCIVMAFMWVGLTIMHLPNLVLWFREKRK